MNVVAKELVGALKAAELFASEDVTRPHLNCVCLERPEDRVLRVTSTDGHTLWSCEIVEARDSGPGVFPSWQLGLADLATIVLRLKHSTEVEVDLGARTIDGLAYQQHAEYFPPYANVVPALTSMVPGKVYPQWNPVYLARAGDAIRAYAKGHAPLVPAGLKKDEKVKAQLERERFLNPPMSFRFGPPDDPAFFFSPRFPRAFAIVMPMKGDGSEAASIESYLSRVRQPAKTKAA